jgi:hypothetical protein
MHRYHTMVRGSRIVLRASCFVLRQAQHDKAQHDKTQHDKAQHDKTQHDKTQHDKTQHDKRSVTSAA